MSIGRVQRDGDGKEGCSFVNETLVGSIRAQASALEGLLLQLEGLDGG